MPTVRLGRKARQDKQDLQDKAGANDEGLEKQKQEKAEIAESKATLQLSPSVANDQTFSPLTISLIDTRP